MAAQAREALNGLGIGTGETDWLSDGEACDIPFDGGPLEAVEKAARDALGSAPVDLAVQGALDRRKKLLIADMDSTIITTETLDDLAERAGMGDPTAAITERAMRGEIDFAEALKKRLSMLAGMDEKTLAETAAGIELSPGARTLVKTMARDGAHTVLVSGGGEYFAERVAVMAGFHEFQANRFEIGEGRLTGTVAEPILDKNAKLNALTRLAAERQIPLPLTLAIGDGANDVPMIRAAGLGIAYKGKPVTRDAAHARIEAGSLTAALFMQGYLRSDFQSDL